MHILILGHDTFAEPLRRLGYRVTLCGTGDGADWAVADPDPDWRMLSREAAARGIDAVLVTDDIGSRKLPCGLWKAEIPTAFYGLDSPLNNFWQEPYARLFDQVWLDQPDEADRLSNVHPNSSWLPVGIDPVHYLGHGRGRKLSGVCFVGVRNDAVRPKRTAILNRVAAKAGLRSTGERGVGWVAPQEAAVLYRSYDVSLNENLFPGVTTRPLEIMASGGCLLTEAAAGSMDRFFRDMEHCAYYDHTNLEHVLDVLLGDGELRAKLSSAGREAVLGGHTLDHRAKEIGAGLQKTAVGKGRAKGGDALMWEGLALTMAGLRWPAKGGDRRLTRGSLRLQAAANDGAEPVKSSYYAGLSLLAAGEQQKGAAFLKKAAEGGGDLENLAARIAAMQGSNPARPSSAMGKSAKGAEGLSGSLGQPGFHLKAAEILTFQGRGMRPGFNGKALPMAMWSAFEHLQYAALHNHGDAEPWERLGDLLMDYGAPWEAHHCLQKAVEINNSPSLENKMREAGKKGYLRDEL